MLQGMRSGADPMRQSKGYTQVDLRAALDDRKVSTCPWMPPSQQPHSVWAPAVHLQARSVHVGLLDERWAGGARPRTFDRQRLCQWSPSLYTTTSCGT